MTGQSVNPAIWNLPASAGGGMRRKSREVASLQGDYGSCRRVLHLREVV